MGRTVRIIGAPMDYGANRRGVDMGPSAIRYADLAEGLERAGVEAIDDGDISMPRAEERDPDAGQPTRGNAKFLREIEDVCSRVGDRVAATLADGAFPSFWVATTRSRSGRSTARRGIPISARSGSTPTRTSIRPKRHPAGTSTGCHWPLPSAAARSGKPSGRPRPDFGVVDRLRRPSEHRRARA